MLSSETRMPVVKPAKVTIHRSDYRTSVQRANVLSMAVSIKSRNDSRHGALAGTSGGDNRGRRQGGVERTSESMEIATLHVKVVVRISLSRRPEHAASALGAVQRWGRSVVLHCNFFWLKLWNSICARGPS
jgi:hypothetical protein